jgi:hypothetical protein
VDPRFLEMIDAAAATGGDVARHPSVQSAS